MAGCPTPTLIRTAALALLWGCGDAAAEAPMRPGDTAPAVVEARPDETVVVWVSRPADYLSCQSPAYALRRIQRRFGDRVKVVAVSIGDPASTLPADFFRAERLDATVLPMEWRRWHRLSGQARLPALYVSRNGRIVRIWSSVAGVQAAGNGSAPPLARAVDSLFAVSATAETGST